MNKPSKYIFLFAFFKFFFLLNPALAQKKDLIVDIGLEDSSARLYLSANKNFKVVSLLHEQVDQELMSKEAQKDVLVRFGIKTNEKLILASEPDLKSSSQDILFTCKEEDIQSDCIWTLRDNQFSKTNKKYRGAILIKAKENSFVVINRIKIEDYLKGVVASEMPSSWHIEALKAQSVAARTYTVSKLNRRASLGYDLKASVEDQVYLGVNNESQRTNEAILATKNQILVDSNNIPIEAYFFSEAGFSTASAADIWGLEHHNYLRPQLINDNNNFWQKNFTTQELDQALESLKLNSITAITILNHNPDGRVRDILISNSHKSLKLSGEELRHKLGLRSTFFDIKIFLEKNNISFIGKGFGHGIGLSQNGAHKLAKQGKNYKDILKFFYPGSNFLEL